MFSVHIKFVFGFLGEICVEKGKVTVIVEGKCLFLNGFVKVNYTFYIFSWD